VGQDVDQAAVVVVIAGIRLDDERPLYAVSLEDRGQLRSGPQLGPGREVVGLRRELEPDRIEDMVMTVDLRFVEDTQMSLPFISVAPRRWPLPAA
jgi:hypothetical protein